MKQLTKEQEYDLYIFNTYLEGEFDNAKKYKEKEINKEIYLYWTSYYLEIKEEFFNRKDIKKILSKQQREALNESIVISKLMLENEINNK